MGGGQTGFRGSPIRNDALMNRKVVFDFVLARRQAGHCRLCTYQGCRFIKVSYRIVVVCSMIRFVTEFSYFFFVGSFLLILYLSH